MWNICSLGLLKLFLSCISLHFCSSLSAAAFGSQVAVNVSHFNNLLCCCRLFFVPLPANSWCSSVQRAMSVQKNSQDLNVFMNFPSDFIHLLSIFLCQEVDIVWIGREMQLLWYHVCLNVKYHKFIVGILSHWCQNRLSFIFYFSRVLQDSYCGGDFVSSVESIFSFSLHYFWTMKWLFHN